MKGYFGRPSAAALGVSAPRAQGRSRGWRGHCAVIGAVFLAELPAARSCKHAAARARVGVLQRAGFTADRVFC